MKARYIQRGESIDYTPTETAVAAGDIIKLGGLVCVTKLDIAIGELGALATVGVYEILSGGMAIAVGDVVHVDPTTGKACASTATGAIKFGYAVTAATTQDATVRVRLEQSI